MNEEIELDEADEAALDRAWARVAREMAAERAQEESDEATRLAAQALADADCLLISAGAGMGVDSGLPDFRGDEGFWKALIFP